MTTLRGLCLLNTRPLLENHTLDKDIQALGGTTVALPAFTIAPLTNWQPPQLDNVDAMIFTSPNAVKHFVAHITLPAHRKIFAIGNATAHALDAHQITATHVPTIATSEHLLALEALQTVKRMRIVLIKGHGGRDLIATTLKARGATVMPLCVYQRQPIAYPANVFAQLWQAGGINIILFTSHEAMQALLNQQTAPLKSLMCSIPWLVISERLRAAAELLGAQQIIQGDYQNIIATLCKYNKESPG